MGVFNVSVLLLTFLLIFVAYLVDRSKDRLFFFSSFISILFLGVSLVSFEYAPSALFTNGRPILGGYEYAIFFLLLLSYPIGVLFSNYPVRLINTKTISYDHSKLALLAYIFSFISFTCFFVNFSRVGFRVDLLFVSPRSYEAIFGRYWFINYGYFLSVPATMLLIYNAYANKCPLSGGKKVLIFLLFVISLFHGIKYTVFDAVLFPVALYVVLNGFSVRNKAMVGGAMLCFILFFSLFSYFVRGGDSYDFFSFLSYILPNYYNFIYLLNLYDFPASMPFDGIFSFASLYIPIERNYSNIGFYLNDRYNMVTGFHLMLASFGYLGAVLFYGVMSKTYVILSGRVTILSVFFRVYILFCCLMMFYGYYFGAKLKYIFFLMVFVLVDFFCRKKKLKFYD